ncbi:M20/M25/M40 family metallo-hydrolase [Massilia sp. TSP1-1-2]|uniref:M20/M25/M40 family metallo-hydrolase n=1 Tax=Massilia sp. TSP1-1-2 TaxID=2804649 RepID=UPI003CFA7F82
MKNLLALIGLISLFAPGAFAASATPLAGAAPLDSATLLADVRTLSAPELAGRRTGSEGSKMAQVYIARRFEQIGIKPFGANYAMPFAFTSLRGQVKTEYPAALNLVGHIRGSVHPERYMVVSAHYDHLGVQKGAAYLGADDNASGVAAMLAVAAYFKQNPPQNTIVFAAFDAEELGHHGARALVKAAPFPIAKVALNLNFDMVSRNDKNEIYAAGTRYTPSLKPLVAKAAASSSVKVRLGHDSKVPGAPPDDDWTGQSDHAVFHEAGIAFLYFGVEDHADYHQPSDSFEKIDPTFFAEVARLLVSAAAILDQNLDTLK